MAEAVKLLENLEAAANRCNPRELCLAENSRFNKCPHFPSSVSIQIACWKIQSKSRTSAPQSSDEQSFQHSQIHRCFFFFFYCRSYDVYQRGYGSDQFFPAIHLSQRSPCLSRGVHLYVLLCSRRRWINHGLS